MVVVVVVATMVCSPTQDNMRMKATLLDTCAMNGINADLNQLNATIAMHRCVCVCARARACVRTCMYASDCVRVEGFIRLHERRHQCRFEPAECHHRHAQVFACVPVYVPVWCGTHD